MINKIVLRAMVFAAALSATDSKSALAEKYVIEGRISNVSQPNVIIETKKLTFAPVLYNRIGKRINQLKFKITDHPQRSNPKLGRKFYRLNEIDDRNYWHGKVFLNIYHPVLRQKQKPIFVTLDFEKRIKKDIQFIHKDVLAENLYEEANKLHREWNGNSKNLIDAINKMDESIELRAVYRSLRARISMIRTVVENPDKKTRRFILNFHRNIDRHKGEIEANSSPLKVAILYKDIARVYLAQPNLLEIVNIRDTYFDMAIRYLDKSIEFIKREPQSSLEARELAAHVFQMKYNAEFRAKEFLDMIQTIGAFFELYPDYANGRVIRTYLADWLTGIQSMTGINTNQSFVRRMASDDQARLFWINFKNSLELYNRQFRWGKSTKSVNLQNALKLATRISKEKL